MTVLENTISTHATKVPNVSQFMLKWRRKLNTRTNHFRVLSIFVTTHRLKLTKIVQLKFHKRYLQSTNVCWKMRHLNAVELRELHNFDAEDLILKLTVIVFANVLSTYIYIVYLYDTLLNLISES